VLLFQPREDSAVRMRPFCTLTRPCHQVLSYRELVTADQGCMTLMPRSKGNLHEFTANTDCAVISSS
jgi:hypothetical protein